jgi:hypothetical protein
LTRRLIGGSLDLAVRIFSITLSLGQSFDGRPGYLGFKKAAMI